MEHVANPKDYSDPVYEKDLKPITDNELCCTIFTAQQQFHVCHRLLQSTICCATQQQPIRDVQLVAEK